MLIVHTNAVVNAPEIDHYINSIAMYFAAFENVAKHMNKNIQYLQAMEFGCMIHFVVLTCILPFWLFEWNL